MWFLKTLFLLRRNSYNIMWSLHILTVLNATEYYICFTMVNFMLCELFQNNFIHHSQAVIFCYFCPLALNNPQSASCTDSLVLPLLDISYKWNRIIRHLLCLASFICEVHPCHIMYQYIISFYGWVIFHGIYIHFVYPFTLLIDIWAVPTLWLLWTVLIGRSGYKHFSVYFQFF